MIAGMVLTNLMYVVGAIVAATVVSAFVLLRHRRPKSLEAGIEMFSRELRALQPERPSASAGGPQSSAPGPRSSSGPQSSAPGGQSSAPGGQSSSGPQSSLPGRPGRADRPARGRTVRVGVGDQPNMAPLGAPAQPRDSSSAAVVERNEARAPSPDLENGPG